MNHKLEIIPCFYPGSKCTVIVNRFDIVEYHLSDMCHCLRIVRCTWFCALGLLYRSLFIREKKSGKKLLWVRILFLVFVTRRFLSEWSNESIRVASREKINFTMSSKRNYIIEHNAYQMIACMWFICFFRFCSEQSVC